MQIIIVQGMTCLGKTTLCKKLEIDIVGCKHFCLDSYREALWDSCGFDSVEQRDVLSKCARDVFYRDIKKAIRESQYEYILVEYVFSDKYWGELEETLKGMSVNVKTLYLKTNDLKTHKKVWMKRSRDCNVRHAGHGATHYHNGVGKGYVNIYDSKVFEVMNTIGETLEIVVTFNPYQRSCSYGDIINFIKS